MESIKKRTSIRKYSEREVTDKLLNSLLEEAERTPTMGNLQLYSVIITRSEEGKKALASAHFNQPMVTEAPVVLTICADYRRTTIWAENRKANPGYDNVLYERCHRRPFVYTDILQSGRRSRTRHLLSRHHRIHASNDYRHLAPTQACDARSYHYLGMAS